MSPLEEEKKFLDLPARPSNRPMGVTHAYEFVRRVPDNRSTITM